MPEREARRPRIAIVGAGFSGLCLAIRLKQAGIESFTIFEKAERLGGTWRENTYPGAACDALSFLYCFSFEQKTDWSRKWAPQPEILEYMEHCAEKYGLRPHIRFGTEVEGARFDADAGTWRVRTTGGETCDAEVLVCAVGQLHRPRIPDLPGLDRFRGEWFHSARWNHDHDLGGKSVAVVGNAASAIQFIPQIAPRTERLLVFQRSANWMFPRLDRAYRESEKRRFGRFPWLARLYRWLIWWRYELMWPLFRGNRFLRRRLEWLSKRAMRAEVSDPRLRELLVPDYPIGGKRMLISDDYYASLGRENVELVSEGIDHLTEEAVVTRDGRVHRIDALILSTGFDTTSFLAPMQIEGRDGRSLDAEWSDGAQAYLGLTVAGFPNFFMMYGPNTNLGHNSIIFMIECQTGYILQCIQQLAARGLRWIDLRPEVMDAYNRRLQQELGRTVWAAPDHSWYKQADGRITNNWSGSTARYWWKTRRVDLSLYHQEARSSAQRGRETPPELRRRSEPETQEADRTWASGSGP